MFIVVESIVASPLSLAVERRTEWWPTEGADRGRMLRFIVVESMAASCAPSVEMRMEWCPTVEATACSSREWRLMLSVELWIPPFAPEASMSTLWEPTDLPAAESVEGDSVPGGAGIPVEFGVAWMGTARLPPTTVTLIVELLILRGS